MRKQHASYAIKEAALIFEAGLETGLDQVIGVTAPVELRIARVMKRDGVPREKVLERMNRQMDEKEKMKRCDFIIENDERTPLLPQVLKIHDTLMKKSAVLPGSG
jgi:dephospho-CoA kinase